MMIFGDGLDHQHQQELLDANGILVVEMEHLSTKGFAMALNGKKYIVVDKGLSKDERFWVIEHELSHLLLDNLYDASTPASDVLKIEFETNEETICRDELLLDVFTCKALGLQADEICNLLQVDKDFYSFIVDYINLTMIDYINGFYDKPLLRRFEK